MASVRVSDAVFLTFCLHGDRQAIRTGVFQIRIISFIFGPNQAFYRLLSPPNSCDGSLTSIKHLNSLVCSSFQVSSVSLRSLLKSFETACLLPPCLSPCLVHHHDPALILELLNYAHPSWPLRTKRSKLLLDLHRPDYSIHRLFLTFGKFFVDNGRTRCLTRPRLGFLHIQVLSLQRCPRPRARACKDLRRHPLQNSVLLMSARKKSIVR